MKKIIKLVFLYLFIFLMTMIYNASYWAINTFNFYQFDEVLFQLTTPIKSASSSVLYSLFFDCILLSIVLATVIFSCLMILNSILSKKTIKIRIPTQNKKILISSKPLKRGIVCIVIILSLWVIYSSLERVKFIDYVKDQREESSFIKDHYVDPKEVSITFPEEKRNLIYIYAESMESTFFSYSLGGGSQKDYLSPLYEITTENLSFSDTDIIGGAVMVTGTSWTTGSMVSQTSGVPLKITYHDIGRDSLLPKATTLGDILKKNGYHQEILFGSDQYFGNRGPYFTTHGNYQVYDYYTAIEKKKIDKDYYVWWGFEDSKLFEIAKEEITSLAQEEEPFNFTLLTTNTHTVDGYIEEDCDGSFSSSYENAIYCSAEQIASFIHWIQEQDFYPNTTIIVVGDHVSMQRNLYPEKTRRRLYNVFINPAISTDNHSIRLFTTMDYFPTTLASLGASIEGDRLGLGTNLFSEKRTLMEEFGKDVFEEEISKDSSYYRETFY